MGLHSNTHWPWSNTDNSSLLGKISNNLTRKTVIKLSCEFECKVPIVLIFYSMFVYIHSLTRRSQETVKSSRKTNDVRVDIILGWLPEYFASQYHFCKSHSQMTTVTSWRVQACYIKSHHLPYGRSRSYWKDIPLHRNISNIPVLWTAALHVKG